MCFTFQGKHTCKKTKLKIHTVELKRCESRQKIFTGYRKSGYDLNKISMGHVL